MNYVPLIPSNAHRVHSVKKFLLRKTKNAGLALQMLLIGSLLCYSIEIRAEGLDNVSITASVLSEPAERGISEANGRPTLALALEWEAGAGWIIGAHGYAATDAPSPQRPQSATVFGGWQWSANDALSFDVRLLHHWFPGDFANNWDHTEARLDAHFSRNLALTFRATDDYYGIGGTSFTAAINAVHDFTNQYYARVEAGGVTIDDSRFDSYAYAEIGGGFSWQRFNFETMLRMSNADPSPAFTPSQVDTAITASVSYRLY